MLSWIGHAVTNLLPGKEPEEPVGEPTATAVDAEAGSPPTTPATPALRATPSKRARLEAPVLAFDQKVRKEAVAISKAYPGKKGLAEWVPAVAHFFFSTKANMLSAETLGRITKEARAVLKKEPCLQYVRIPADASITIIGDTHGYYDDVYTILQAAGMPSERNFLLFNGDFVDRGPKQLQNATLILLLKLAFPKYVWVTKGNHECEDVNGDEEHATSFISQILECEKTYQWEEGAGRKVFQQFVKAFEEVPLAMVLSDPDGEACVLVCHGGLPSKADTKAGLSLAEIAGWSKTEKNDESEQLFWNDPAPKEDPLWRASPRRPRMTPNERGEGVYYFGAGVSAKFLSQNNLQLIVRSHEEKEAGYELEHIKGRRALVCSVFSIPKYEGSENLGAFLRIPGAALGPEFEMKHEMAIQFPCRQKLHTATLADLQQKVQAADAAVEEQPRVARKLAFTPPRPGRKSEGTESGTPSRSRGA